STTTQGRVDAPPHRFGAKGVAMVAESKKLNLEVPEEDLIDEHTAVDEESYPTPLDTRETLVSEADWADQQIDASFDDEDEPEGEAQHRPVPPGGCISGNTQTKSRQASASHWQQVWQLQRATSDATLPIGSVPAAHWTVQDSLKSQR